MTNYLNFKLSAYVEKNPEPTENMTESRETVFKPVMQRDSSIMQLVSPIILMQSRLDVLGLQAIDIGGAGDCFFRSVSHHYMAKTTIIWKVNI